MAKITYGSTMEQIRKASFAALVDCLITPDGAGDKNKTLALQELLARERRAAQKGVQNVQR